MDHRDVQRAAAMAKMNADRQFSVEGGIVDAAGNLVAVAGQYAMQDDEPRPDETVYQVHGAWLGPDKLHLEPTIRRGRVMVTFQAPGGGGDDVALVFLKGVALPPKGMRLAIRILAPAKVDQEEFHAEADRRTQQEGTVQEARETETSASQPGRDGSEGRGTSASRPPEVLGRSASEPGPPPDSAV